MNAPGCPCGYTDGPIILPGTCDPSCPACGGDWPQIADVVAGMDDATLRAFVSTVREVLVDEDGSWRELNSCADAVQDISLALSAAGVGGNE